MLFSGVIFSKIFTGAVVVALSLALLNILLLILSYLWERVWAYIDEQEVSRGNLWGDFLATRFFGFELAWKSGSCYDYRRKGENTGVDRDWLSINGLLLVPGAILLVIAVQFYHLTIIATVLYVIVRLARYTRRLAKKLDAHAVNPDAHKVEITNE